MATVTSTYNHTANLFMSGQLPASSTFKVMFLGATGAFVATDTTLTQVSNAGAKEVYGYGWDQGGEALTGVAYAIAETNKSNMSATSPSVTLSGGNLTWYSYVIYCNTLANDPPLFFVAMNSALTVTDGNAAGISIPSNLLAQLSLAA